MKTEIEVKFTDIVIDEIRKKLKDCDAVLVHPMRLMKRALIEEPHHKADKSFLRVRDEGDKVTLTFKRRASLMQQSIDNVDELEVVVSSFEDTIELLREAGWKYKTFQETKRETWHIDDVEVVIDEWPWLKPYIEIEGETEQAVRAVAEKLGFDWQNAQFGHIDAVYAQYYTFANKIRGVIDVPDVRFDDPLPKDFVKKL